jgi:hypothetical protein
MRQSSWLRSLVFGVGFSLSFMSVYDCAYVGTQFEGSLVGWASFQGMRLLELPGSHLFVSLFGLEEIYNADPNLLIPFRIGFPAVVMVVLGMVVGFLWPSRPYVSEQPERPGDTGVWGHGVLVLSLVGAVGFGFLLGFLAFVLGVLLISRPVPVPKPSRVSAWLGIVIGALDVAGWTIGLAIQLEG